MSTVAPEPAQAANSTRHATALGPKRLFHGAGQLLHQFADLRIVDDERRRQQDVIAGLSVNRAAHRIADQTGLKRRRLDPGGNLAGRACSRAPRSRGCLPRGMDRARAYPVLHGHHDHRGPGHPGDVRIHLPRPVTTGQ